MPQAADTVIAAARDFLGDRITTNATLREHHSHGQDTQPPVLPDAVAFIETADEAARLLTLCNNAASRWSPGAPAPRWRATSPRSEAASRSTSPA